MNADALAKAREIAARLSGSISGSELGKRKNRWGDDEGNTQAAGLGSIKKKKIYVPVNDYPEINFLGLLIGPKGITQKQLQDSTGAKILFRGRGASKDGGPSNTGHPDDNDDLHVCVEGNEDAVDRATREIEKILFNPEQAQKLKQEQLRQLAELNQSSGDIYGPGGQDGGYQVELRVPNNMVGLVIGKGGDNILRIQTQLSVHVQIAKESEMKPGETLRSIVIKGEPANVNEAKSRVDDIINGHLAKQNPTGSSNAIVLDNAFVVKLPVPNDKVGIIIGKNGATIKSIQERTNAIIKIPQGPDEDNPQVRTISIGGDTKESVDAAQMEIFMTLQAQQQNALQAYNSTSTSMPLAVPDDKIGIVIGKGGATIKEIQNRLQCKVQIPQVADIGSNPPVRTISIIGSAEGQAQAKYEIEMIVAGTPVHGSKGQANNYGYDATSLWNQYGNNYYGDTYSAAYAAYGSYYENSGQYAQADANKDGAAAATDAVTAVPTDPTAYYNDFWKYAAYYGEAAARLYFDAWSPPVGTPPPEGITIPTTADVPASDAQQVSATKDNAVEKDTTQNETTSSETTSTADAWEAYKKQYSEWYEAYGKALGADPNPPSTTA